MRALVVSHAYVDPAARGKLKALAGLGVAVAAAMPEQLRTATGERRQTAWGDDNGVRIAPIPVRGGPEPGELSWNRSALERLFGEFRPDIVQIEEEPGSAAGGTAARLAKRAGVPYVVVCAESLPATWPLLQRLRRERTLRGTAAVVGINRLALDLAAGTRDGTPRLILPQLGLGIPAATEPTPRSGLAIGFVGRLVPERGLDLLMRACVKVHGGWTLTVVGSGPEQEELELLAERLGIAARVTWLGALPRSELPAVWRTLDCLVCPSRSTPHWVETTGRTALEAMARSLPVVAADSGALPDVVGATGVVVPEDDAAALTAALQRLAGNPAERLRLGALARQRVLREYTDAALAEKTLDLWQQVVGREALSNAATG